MSFEYTLRPSPAVHAPQIDYAKELNEEQYAAVTAPPGPLLIIAGAGSGKTRTLTYRVAYLIENGVEPENILLATFTNKAAREMVQRVGSLLPHDISRMWGGTFHHIANRFLRRHANALGYGLDFTITDRDDAKDLLNGCYGDAGIDPKDKQFPKADVALEMFGMAANVRKNLPATLESNYPFFLEQQEGLVRLLRVFAERKKAANVMDYDDLLTNALGLLQQDPELRERYQNHFQHILVDEYQDTNKLQADLIDLLAENHKQVMVVGDDAQSIYSWRGANFLNILSFPERYPGTRTVYIQTNYRSTPEILALANAAIAPNTKQFKKDLHAARPGPNVKPALVCLGDANLQAQFIAQRIAELHEEGIELNEIAILYRAHYHAMELQMELTRRQVPFQITSGLRFFEQKHVKDVCAYIKLAVNPRDEIAFKRIAGMQPGIGEKTADKLWRKFNAGTPLDKVDPPAKAAESWKQWAATHEQLQAPELENKVTDQIRLVVEAVYEAYARIEFPNFEARLEDLSQLRAFSETFETTDEFLAQLSLLTNLDDDSKKSRKGSDDQAVRLSTVHQAKGLEWKAVFVIMLCEGLFPSSRSTETSDGEEEERRLFYVAVTRARDELYLTYPVIRASAGYRDTWQSPSRFLLELNRDLVNEWKINRTHDF